jgi:hypothetical protein
MPAQIFSESATVVFVSMSADPDMSARGGIASAAEMRKMSRAMKRSPILAALACALALAGCVAVPAYEPTFAPPAAYVAPPAVAVQPVIAFQPYVYAHWGHYYRGPYGR